MQKNVQKQTGESGESNDSINRLIYRLLFHDLVMTNRPDHDQLIMTAVNVIESVLAPCASQRTHQSD